MLFDGHLQVVGMEVAEAEDHIELVLMFSFTLQGPQGMIPVPFGIGRIPMGRDAAIQHGKALVEAGEKLPEKKQSDIVVAQSLAGVDQAMKQQEAIKGKKK